MKELIPHERIESRIYVIRGQKVMLDRDLANLYRVKTTVFNQAVRRNIERFPDDFMFQLTSEEHKNLMSQFVISSSHGGVRKLPLVFTEPGVAMLSSVLRSPQAVAVNIQIIRTFIRMREMLIDNDRLRLKVETLEKQYDEQFKTIFDAPRRMFSDDATKTEIGYTTK